MVRSRVAVGMLIALSVGSTAWGAGGKYDEASTPRRTAYGALAVAANIIPVVSAFYAPRCLPGYIVCKITFAGISVIAAADQLALSGGGDLNQTRAILYRGFAGDWFVTPRHVAGDAEPRVLPDPPPAPTESGDGTDWQPPPR